MNLTDKLKLVLGMVQNFLGKGEFSKGVGNTLEKGEIACYEQFLLFP